MDTKREANVFLATLVDLDRFGTLDPPKDARGMLVKTCCTKRCVGRQ